MLLRSADGVYAYHLTLTPGGWALVCMGRDILFEPSGGFRYMDALARQLKANGHDHFKPLFEIDYLGGGLVNVLCNFEGHDNEQRAEVRSHLHQLDSEFNLGLTPLLETTLCTNFLNGINGNRSLRSDLRNSGSIPTPTSRQLVT